MDECSQKRIMSYLAKGHTVVIFPTLPTRDMNLMPCKYMLNKLGIGMNEYLKVSKVYYKDEFQGHVRAVQTFDPKSAVAIATTDEGKCCGLIKKHGKGQVILLGFQLLFTSRNHLAVLEDVLGGCGDPQQVSVDNPNIHFVFRTGQQYGFLFLFNRLGVYQECRVRVNFSNGKKQVSTVGIRVDKKIGIPPSGLILPINVPIGGEEAFWLEFCDTDVLRMKASEKGISLCHYSPVSKTAETVIRTSSRPQAVRIDGNQVEFTYDGKRLRFNYTAPVGEYTVDTC